MAKRNKKSLTKIFKEILDWTQGIPAWQSNAVARLLVKQARTTEDVNDLFALVKSEQGIPDPKRRKSNPLTAEQIPAPVDNSIHVELYAMKNLQPVRRP